MPRIEQNKIERMIGGIYESVSIHRPDGWDTCYRELSRMLSSGPGSLHFFRRRQGRFDVLADTNEAGFIEDFNSKYFEMMPYKNEIARLRPGQIFLRSNVISDAEYREHEFYREHFRRMGIFHIAHVCLIETGDAAAGITFTRPETMRPFSAEELEALKILTPHLQRAMSISIEIAGTIERERMLTTSLDKLAQPIVIADSAGKLYHRNDAAEPYFGEDGVFTLGGSGLITCSRTERTSELRSLIEGITNFPEIAARGVGGVINLRTRLSDRPIAVLVSPQVEAATNTWQKQRYATMFISDPTRPLPSLNEDLMVVYGMTKREAEISVLLADGLAVNDVSDLLQLSRHTVRTHLKRALQKTGTNRQANLVKFVLGLAGVRFEQSEKR